MKFTGPVAYLTGEYPRATDTFIQREVSALRQHGLTVLTCSIRRTDKEHLVGEEQRSEAATTFYVLQAARRLPHLVGCHLRALISRPGRYSSALLMALRKRPSGLKALLYQLFYFAEAVILSDHLQKNDVKHLHNHIAKSSCTVAMLTSRLSGIPFSFTLHGPDIFFEPFHWQLSEKIAAASFVSCISHFCRSQAMIFSAPEHWEKLHIVHCGVEPERYQRKTICRNGNQLLFVGRLAGVKGVTLLLHAVAKLSCQYPDLHLTLIGDGSDRTMLEAETKRLGLETKVTFAGYKSQDDVAAAFLKSDIFILPSFAEGLPVVLMEALAAGLPVVTTRIAGISELVEDGKSGILVPPGDAESLTDAIRDLLNAPAKRISMGEVGTRKVQAEFDIRKEARGLHDRIAAFHNSTG